MNVHEALSRWQESRELQDRGFDSRERPNHTAKSLPECTRPLEAALRHYPTAELKVVGEGRDGFIALVLVTPHDVPEVPQIEYQPATEGKPEVLFRPGVRGRKAGKPFHLLVR